MIDMKKIFLTLAGALLLSGWMMAQTPANRTVSTIVADALAQLPADNLKDYNDLMQDLAGTGEEGILALAKQMNAPGKGSNATVEYALSGIAHYAATKGDETLRAAVSNACVKALGAATDRETKAFLVALLQVAGKDEAVDALAPLLGLEELSDPAARALASIGTEKAGKALRSALLRRTGTAQHVVLAIGEARIGGTEDVLLGLLPGADENLTKDVLYALSRVGGTASVKTLYAAAEKAGFGYDRTNATEAYVALLKNLATGSPDDKQTEQSANDLLKKAAKAGQNHTRIAALQILLNLQKEKGLKLVQTALGDPCIEYRNAALDYFSPYVTDKAYVELLKTVAKSKKPEVKVDIINWLGREAAQCPDKKAKLSALETGIETTAVQDLLKQLGSADVSVKQATAAALVSIGNTQVIPALAGLLTSSDPQVIAVGKASLATMKGDVSPAVAKVISSASDNGKIAAAELLAIRKATGHINNVLDLIKTGSPEVKIAAYEALKDVVGEKDLTNLCGMLESAEGQAIEPLQQAVISSLSSQPKAQQAETVIRRMYQAGESKKHLYYLPLAVTGESKALDMITDGFAKGSKDAKDAAFDALLQWEGPEAAEQLFAVCVNPSASSYFDRAVAAYVRLVSSPSITGENRLLSLRKAMEVAKTDAQKNDILRRIGRTDTYLALLYAGEYIDQSALKETAAQAVMTIALNHTEYTGENVVALLNKAAAALNNSDADYQRQSIRKHLDEMPQAKGFVSLFNGKDLTGWKGLVENPIARAKMTPAQLAKAQTKADEQMRKDWIVENGLLAFVGKGFDNLCTEKQYGDFEMYVDWMLDPAGPEADAGVYLRGTPQVQIWDTARTNVGAQVGSGGLYNNRVHRSTPLKVADNKLGEWNTLYIKMIGDRVTVRLNGELVVDDIILENYWDRAQPVPAIEQLELQAHGSKVYYRNIYVNELERPEPFQLSAEEKKDGFKMLFDGTNMHEWIGNLVDYKMADGCIVVDPASHFGGNLYTKEEYADFIFRFEFQLTPAANNGLGIRTPMEGDAAYVGMELQILDSEHPVYKDLEVYQYHGSVYGIIPARRGFLKPTGEWNYEEVIADGSHIKITLNGTVILDGDIKEATKNGTPDHKEHPGLFNPGGHIGFLGHGSPLKFKNIRVKRLK
jgi:HEAT repeat protein